MAESRHNIKVQILFLVTLLNGWSRETGSNNVSPAIHLSDFLEIQGLVV